MRSNPIPEADPHRNATAARRQDETRVTKRAGGFAVLCLLLACGQAMVGQVHAVPVYMVSTYAGNGVFGYNGDGIAATGAELYFPESIAMDGSGNLYVADASNNRIRKVSAATGLISTVAGGGTGCVAQTDSVGDGCPATSATLNGPSGVALDSAGNLYIADYSNQRVREVSATTGVITTVAGTGYTHAGGLGGYNGDNIAATSAQLNDPFHVALDSAGNLYIADSSNQRIRKVTVATGIITTVVGTGTAGYNGDNIAATAAKLNGATGVALDSAGNLYIADTFNSRIRKVTVATGMITTVAGNGSPGVVDGVTATSAEINYPYGVLVDASGNLFITDTWNGQIREVSAANGVINTLAGNGTQGYNADGVSSTNAELNYPYGMVLDAAGDIYVADVYNDRVRMLSPLAQFAQTAVGASASQTFTFDVGAGTTIGSIKILTQGATGLDFKAQSPDASVTLCKAQTYSAATTCTVDVTFAPLAPGVRMGAIEIADGSGNLLATEYIAGTGTGPQPVFYPGKLSTIGSGLNGPAGLATDSSGNLYIADANNNRVLKETLTGGSYTQSTIGSGLATPAGVAVDGAGNVTIVDRGSNRVLEETLTGGSYTQSTIVSGLFMPQGVAVDSNGDIYVADFLNNRVLKETLSGGSYTQSTVGSGLSEPAGVAVDAEGNVYLSVVGSNSVLKETLSGGSFTQSVVSNSLYAPYGVAVDGNGNVYIADSNNNRVVKETASGSGYTQSVVMGGGLNGPEGVALDSSGNVYIADSGNNRVVKLDVSDAPSLSFAATAPGATSSDSPQTMTVVNNGNTVLTFPIPASGVDPSISTGFNWNSTGSTACPQIGSGASMAGTLAAGASCTLPISFTPATPGSYSGSLVLTDTALNATNATQTIALNGTGTGYAQTITFAPLTSPVTYGVAPMTLSATATSGLTVTFSVVSGPGTVSGNLLTVTGAGTIVVAANQAGNATYAAAPQVTQSVVVNQAAQTITFPNPGNQTYGVAPITLTATASSGLPIVYTVTSGPATVYGSVLSITGRGTVTVQAAQGGNTNYMAATPVSVSFTVTGVDFLLSLSPTALSVAQGGSAGSAGSVSVIVLPLYGLNQAVQFSCAGLPANASCAFQPATVTPNGASVASTMTIATDGRVAAVRSVHGRMGLELALCMGPLGLLALRRRAKGGLGKGVVLLVLLASAIVAGAGLNGCGWGGTAPPWWAVTPTGTYTVTVTASTVASGGPSHSASLALTITN